MASKDDQSDSESLDSQEMAPSCGPCNCPATAFYSLGAALLLIGGLIFVVFCSEVAPPYAFTRAFEKTTCTVTAAEFLDDVCCEGDVINMDKCQEGYNYPCAHVSVTYEDGNDVISATLYDEYKSQYYRTKTAKKAKCSYFHCGAASYKTHKSNAKNFLKKYEFSGNTGDEIECFVQPDEHKRIAFVARTSRSKFSALLVISLILMFVGGAICLVVFIWATKVRRKHQAKLDQSKEELISELEDTTDTKPLKDDRPGKSSADIENQRYKAPGSSRPATRAGINLEIKDSKKK